MANTLTAIINEVLVRGLGVLRSRTVMPALVSREQGGILSPAQKGQTVQVPIYQDVTVNDVSASSTPLSPSNSVPTYANITLDQWKEGNFHLTDKEMNEVFDMPDFLGKKTDKVANAMARKVNEYLLAFSDDAPATGKPGGVYNAVGTAGTTPFSSDATILNTAAALLNYWDAPLEERYGVLDFQAAANLKNLQMLRDASQKGDVSTIRDGVIGRVFGVDFYEDGQVPLLTAASTDAKTATLKKASSTSNLLLVQAGTDATAVFGAGTILKIAGNFQTFMVVSTVSVSSNTTGALTVVPAITASLLTVASGAALTAHGTQRLNLMFQRGAFAFAQRPLGNANSLAGFGAQIAMQELTDPVTGISMRLEILRQTKQYMWQFDILYGGQLIRPELACRLMG